MAVISNRDKPFQEVLNEHGIGEFFDFSLAGGEVNTFKPEPGVFEHALKRVNLSPREAIYVGDNYLCGCGGLASRRTSSLSFTTRSESSPTRLRHHQILRRVELHNQSYIIKVTVTSSASSCLDRCL